MLKTYKIKLNNKEFEIQQDNDGVFIKPDFIKELESVGTALKPAVEPVVMARKPLAEKTVAENCLKWKTGGINIDISKIKEYNIEEAIKEYLCLIKTLNKKE